MDPWAEQDTYAEVWIEKDALLGVIERAADAYRVTRMACRGYTSATAALDAGRRFAAAREDGKECILIHLGDHDPSGIDMTRDNWDRTELFSRGDIEVRRIALNMPQIREYNPPPNPAKFTDSRAMEYVSRYGRSSWELDALDPAVLDRLVRDEVESCITDPIAWDRAMDEEDRRRSNLRKLSENWDDVETLLSSL